MLMGNEGREIGEHDKAESATNCSLTGISPYVADVEALRKRGDQAWIVNEAVEISDHSHFRLLRASNTGNSGNEQDWRVAATLLPALGAGYFLHFTVRPVPDHRRRMDIVAVFAVRDWRFRWVSATAGIGWSAGTKDKTIKSSEALVPRRPELLGYRLHQRFSSVAA